MQRPSADYQRRASAPDGLLSRCRECINGSMSRRYHGNRADIIQRRATWRATDEGREAVWAQTVESRARAFSAPVVERVHRLDVFNRDGWLCTLCAEPMRRETGQHPRSATVDHTVPLAEGGSHVLDNCASAHRACNRMKADSPVQDHWARQWKRSEGQPMPLGKVILWR